MPTPQLPTGLQQMASLEDQSQDQTQGAYRAPALLWRLGASQLPPRPVRPSHHTRQRVPGVQARMHRARKRKNSQGLRMLHRTPAAQCPWLGGNDADIIGSNTATLKAFRLSTTNARRGSALSMAGASSASSAAGRTPSAKACPTTPPRSFGASGASMLRQDAAAGQSARQYSLCDAR